MEISATTPHVSMQLDMELLHQDPAHSPAAVAEGFEAVFASQLAKELRNTLSEGLFGSEHSDVLGGMFDLHIGQAMAEGRGMGIKQMVLEHLAQITD